MVILMMAEAVHLTAVLLCGYMNEAEAVHLTAVLLCGYINVG